MHLPAELGGNIKAAREARGMSQEELAKALGFSRTNVVLIETNKRGVSLDELQIIADKLRRTVDELIAKDFTPFPDPVPAFFRRHQDVTATEETVVTVRRAVELGRALADLERKLGLHRETGPAAKYVLPEPTGRWDAIQQGEFLADAERRRLGLGLMPLGDMSDFLESQGVRTAVEDLPEEISGLVLPDPLAGTFVMINRTHTRERRRFSHAHEYAHVLVDLNEHDEDGMISRESCRNDHREVRANTFAACFLMPAEGLRQMVAALGKGRSIRFQGDVFDGNNAAVPAEGRTDASTQNIQLYDVLHIAYHFGVSVPAVLFRLRNLRLISETDLERMRAHPQELVTAMAIAMGLRLPPDEHRDREEEARNKSRRQFVLRACDAYRRKLIDETELLAIGRSCKMKKSEVDALLEQLNLLFSGHVHT